MGKLMKRITKAVTAALAAIAAHTSFATETINATGGAANAGAVAGATSISGASAGAVGIGGAGGNGGMGGQGGNANYSGGNTRAYALGMSAAANPNLCMYPTLAGAMQNQEDLCAVLKESAALTEKVSEKAGSMHLCSLIELRTTILAVHGKDACNGIPLRNDPRAPYFSLTGWHTTTSDAYGANVRERPDPMRVGAP